MEANGKLLARLKSNDVCESGMDTCSLSASSNRSAIFCRCITTKPMSPTRSINMLIVVIMNTLIKYRKVNMG